MANRHSNISKNKKPQAHPAVLVLLVASAFLISFLFGSSQFVAYQHVQNITLATTIFLSIPTYLYLKVKVSRTSVGKPVFKGANPKDRRVYIYLFLFVGPFFIHSMLVTSMALLSYLSIQNFKSYIIVDKEHIERSTYSRIQTCKKGNYELGQTLHFKMQLWLKICLDEDIYDQMPDIAVLNVSGKKSFLGHRIQKISYSPEKQKDVGIIFESIKKEWQPFEP